MKNKADVEPNAGEQETVAALEKQLVDVHEALERELAATIARYKSLSEVRDRGTS